jgi:hypothetical protein
LKYLLAHDNLPVVDEREVMGVVWRFAANKPPDVVDTVVGGVRLSFLATKDLLTVARDHLSIRSSPVFRQQFRSEFLRRTANKPPTEKPRKAYESQTVGTSDDYSSEIIEWIIGSNHHQGYEERIEELKKRIEQQKNENCRTRADLHAKNQEMHKEWEKIQALNTIPNVSQNSYNDTEVFYTPEKNCLLF